MIKCNRLKLIYRNRSLSLKYKSMEIKPENFIALKDEKQLLTC